jgi:hypothetical protein
MMSKIERVLLDNPGLKGKEIAKIIGEERKDVNAFLHRNTDRFSQEKNFCWFLSVPSEVRVEFEKDQWMNSDSFEKSLSKVGSPLDLECNAVIFIIPKKCNILLDAAARLLALCNQLSNAGRLVKIDFSECKSTLGYFDRIGFIDHLDMRVTVLPKRPSVSKAKIYKGNNEAVLEFGGVSPDKESKELINQLTNRFVQQSDNKYETAAGTVFGEMIGNISEHSQSSMNGFAALQKYGGRRGHIQTVVSDSGLGIVATLTPSLGEHYPMLYKMSNQDNFELKLVTEVMTKGEISRFGSGRGLGFKSSREQAIKFDARLSVRQKNFSIAIDYSNGEICSVENEIDLPTINGTHICFDFFVD